MIGGIGNLKPTKKHQIERWTHMASGTTLTTYYNPATEKFWCQVGGQAVFSDKRSACREEAEKLANEVLHDESRWRRVIFMTVEPPTASGVFKGGTLLVDVHKSPRVGFVLQRSWILDGHLDGKPCRFTREWQRAMRGERDYDHQAERHDVQPLHVMIKDYFAVGQTVTEIPYTNETWESLMSMSNALEEARTRLTALVAEPAFHAALATGKPVALLGSGS
jgi:hypothetical protein